MVETVIEGVGMLIILFWVVTHSNQFDEVLGQVTSAYTSGIQTIWGGSGK